MTLAEPAALADLLAAGAFVVDLRDLDERHEYRRGR